MFIDLTNWDGEALTVNTDYIAVLEPYVQGRYGCLPEIPSGGTWIHYSYAATAVSVVKESLEEVRRMLTINSIKGTRLL